MKKDKKKIENTEENIDPVEDAFAMPDEVKDEESKAEEVKDEEVKDEEVKGEEAEDDKPTDIPDSPKKQTIEDLAENTSGPAQKRALARAEEKKRKKKMYIIGGITIGVCILSILGAMLFSFLSTSFEEDASVRDELTATSFNEPFYMLLVGTDTREGKSYKLTDGRSDSCILVRIDPVNYVVTMISIPRDTKITVDGNTQKFNAVYAYGGIKATIQQVKKMMGIDISHYAEVSFNGLTDMVNAVGGVEVDVPNAINDPNAGVSVAAGKHVLNGEEALAFSRSRHFGDGDFTRTADQRVLIDALIRKAYSMDVSEVSNVLRAAKNFVRTDLRLGDMISLATKFMTADQEMKIYSAMVPSTTSSEGGVSYVITDKSALSRMIKMIENGEDPLMVEIDSGASVCSSRDAEGLEEKRKAYYIEHPDSPGRIANSYNSYNDNYN